MSKLMLLAFFILIIGSVITFYETRLSKLDIPKKSKAVVTSKDIKKGEEITGNHLKEISVYKPDKLNDGITDMNKLLGKIALTDMISGKEITEREITTNDKWFEDNEKEIGITFKHFTDIVGGTGKPEDIVDIMLSHPLMEDENKEVIIQEPEAVIENVSIIDVYDESNISYGDSKEKDIFKPITILVKLTEEQEKLVDVAQKKGRIYLRRHGNYIRVEEDKKQTSKAVIRVNGE